MNKEAINVQTNTGCSEKNSGPGLILKDWNDDRITAAVPEVGIPSASKGTREPAAFALFAASGPATPSMAPFPNSPLFFASLFSSV